MVYYTNINDLQIHHFDQTWRSCYNVGMKYDKNKILTPMYDRHGGHTELTVCAHEAAHAVMRYHAGMKVTDLEIFREQAIDSLCYSGRCLGGGEDPSTKGMIDYYAAGYAWEWRNTHDLFERYAIVHYGHFDIGSGVNDCSRISECLIEELNLGDAESTGVEWTDVEYKKFRDAVEELFLRTWKTIQRHYLETISAIAVELSKVDLLPAEKVLSIIKKNLDLESPEPTTVK